MILFVDDEYRTLGGEGWLCALVEAGYRCLPVATPDEAITAVRERPEISGAVVDLMLPVGTLDIERADGGLKAGIVLIERVREIRPELPIVVLSLRRDCMDEVGNLKTGFVSKTLDEPEDLVAALGELKVRKDNEQIP